MTRISDLSQDLIEEILSRVPLTSHRAARSACKQWNGLYKDERFTKKHLGKQANDTMVIMVCDSRVCLASVDLLGVRKKEHGFLELSTKPIGQLNHITVSEVYHCDGLLFCLAKKSRVESDYVVWNPYLGQARWIKPREKLTIWGRYRYCMGHDNKKNHKILRFLDHDNGTAEHEIYDIKSDSWRVLDLTRDWMIRGYRLGGLFLKGNTYFVGRKREAEKRESLICFDFTSERFRHCLDLQSKSLNGDSVTLSCVREEQLAVLLYSAATYEIEIRITSKIEANEVIWTSFLKIDMKPFGFSEVFWKFLPYGSFFVDENKKVALICDSQFFKVYMIGEDNYFKKVVSPGKSIFWPVVCSYVPSSVKIPKGPIDA